MLSLSEACLRFTHSCHFKGDIVEKRETVQIEIPYFQKGESKIKYVNIKYVNYAIQRRYQSILLTITEAEKLNKQQRSLLREIGATVHSKIPFRERRQKVKELNEQNEKLQNKILSLEPEKGDTYNKLINLSRDLLEVNGCEDEELKSNEFWENKVDPEEIWRFLLAAVSKDIKKGGSKKK